MGSEMCIRDSYGTEAASQQLGTQNDSSDESSTASGGCARTVGATRGATGPTAPDRPGRFPVVTTVPVDKNYNFPKTELEAMTYEIAGMIEDIGRMDDYRRNMMDELKVLRDVTLFYNERYPELRSAVRKRAEDPSNTGNTGRAEHTEPERPATDGGNERPATDDKPSPTQPPQKTERAGQSPTPHPEATQEDSPGRATGDAGTTTKGEQ